VDLYLHCARCLHIQHAGSSTCALLQFRRGETRPILTIGERFQPGGGQTRLCQPTAVAVSSSGHVFVADGYCNHRVLRFSPRGRLLGLISLPTGESNCAITTAPRLKNATTQNTAVCDFCLEDGGFVLLRNDRTSYTVT